MTRSLVLVAVVLGTVLLHGTEVASGPREFLARRIGLSTAEIAAIERGDPVVKVLPSATPAEIILFGAVHVRAAPADYVRLAFDLGRLRRLPGYLAVGRFGDAPALTDLEGFSLEPAEVGSLARCDAGRCGMQMSVDAMQELRKAVDWSAAEVGSQVNTEVRKMALAIVQRYGVGGNQGLGTYGDKDRPVQVADEFTALVQQTDALPIPRAELIRHLLDVPDASRPAAESLLYWEHIVFGLKPTLRVNHAIAYAAGDLPTPTQVVAVKQLYASHYFQVALDLSVCIDDGRGAGGEGFYLMTLKASKQAGLTGMTGSLIRRVVVVRARAAQRRALLGVKTALER